MKKITFLPVLLLAILVSTSFTSAQTPTPSPAPTPVATCPDMNGHFRHSQIGATADAYITQTACATMEIKVTADILGKSYNEDYTSPLDGVTRQYPPPAGVTDETDYASAEFNGSTVVFIIEQDKTSNGQVTKSVTEVQGVLTSPNVLQITSSSVDANGNLSNNQTFDFNRVQ